MERRIDLHFHVSYEPRVLRPWLAAALLLLAAGELGSENVTLTTYYPAPSGMYTQMIVTGKTVLARDGNNVGIGTETPGEKLDVSGNARLSGPNPQILQFAGVNEAISRQSDGDLTLTSGGLERLRIDSANGQVGIGNTAPGATLDVTGTIKANTNLSIAGNPPGTRPYVYVNGAGSSCGSSAVNNGSCAGGYFATWTPGVYIDNSFWGAGPNLNFTTVTTPLGNQTNITTTAPTYYCCLKN